MPNIYTSVYAGITCLSIINVSLIENCNLLAFSKKSLLPSKDIFKKRVSPSFVYFAVPIFIFSLSSFNSKELFISFISIPFPIFILALSPCLTYLRGAGSDFLTGTFILTFNWKFLSITILPPSGTIFPSCIKITSFSNIPLTSSDSSAYKFFGTDILPISKIKVNIKLNNLIGLLFCFILLSFLLTSFRFNNIKKYHIIHIIFL